MNRYVVAFALIAALSLGALAGTGTALMAAEDDLAFTQEVFYGDASALDGLRVDMTCADGAIGWETAVRFTDGTFSSESRFSFRPDRDGTDSDVYSARIAWLSLNDWQLWTYTYGVGEADVGGIVTNDTLERMVRGVAERTKPGYCRTETLTLSDYAPAFEWELSGRIGATYFSLSKLSEQRALQDAFALSTRGYLIGITVDKDKSGRIVGISSNLTGQERTEEMPLEEADRGSMGEDVERRSLGDNMSAAAVGKYGLWLRPSVIDENGAELVEFRDGPGIYFAPVPKDPSSGFDYKGIRLLHPCRGVPESLRLISNDQVLEYVERDGSRITLTLLDPYTGQVLDSLALFDGAETGLWRTVNSADLSLYILADGRYVLTRVESEKISAVMTGKMDALMKLGGLDPEGLYLDPDAILAYDGRRLAVCGARGFIMALDETGVTYLGRVFPELSDAESAVGSAVFED